jgi:hypothetical protein
VPYREEGTMPRTTATITGQQRDALYEQVRNHLGALNDVWIAMECNRDFATAERLGIEFGEDFRLLHDLGWDESDSRKVVELTMPREDLIEVLARLGREAEGGLTDSEEERESKEKDEEILQGFRLVRNTCDELIEKLDPRRGESA